MTFLTVLFTMIVVVLLMVVVLGGVSFGLGTLFYKQANVTPGAGDTDKCAQCNADLDWYDTLPLWKKTVVVAWWVTNRQLCAQKGCAQALVTKA